MINAFSFGIFLLEVACKNFLVRSVVTEKHQICVNTVPVGVSQNYLLANLRFSLTGQKSRVINALNSTNKKRKTHILKPLVDCEVQVNLTQQVNKMIK
jgi:hypothetical protein